MWPIFLVRMSLSPIELVFHLWALPQALLRSAHQSRSGPLSS